MKKVIAFITGCILIYLHIVHNSALALVVDTTFHPNKTTQNCYSVHTSTISHECCFIKDNQTEKNCLIIGVSEKLKLQKSCIIPIDIEKNLVLAQIEKRIFIGVSPGDIYVDSNSYTSLVGIIKILG